VVFRGKSRFIGPVGDLCGVSRGRFRGKLPCPNFALFFALCAKKALKGISECKFFPKFGVISGTIFRLWGTFIGSENVYNPP
jgi:hypothetical protein